jgi:hypothetical protein
MQRLAAEEITRMKFEQPFGELIRDRLFRRLVAWGVLVRAKPNKPMQATCEDALA